MAVQAATGSATRGRGLAARLGWRGGMLLAALGAAGLAAIATTCLWRLQGPSSPATIACGLLGFGTAGLLLAMCSRIGRALARLRTALEAMKGGDLSRGCEIGEGGEVGAIADALDAMNFNLSAIVADIRSQSTLVSDAG